MDKRDLTPGDTGATSAAGTPSSFPHRWPFLAIISLGLLMISLDNSILYTALPVLEEELHANSAQALWIINAYPLVLSGLLLGTGTLGDRIGHRRMFVAGLTIFGISSLAAAYAPTAGWLIANRAFLGLGAAVMMPATLALIRATFLDERERNTAMGLWGSTGVIGAAAGPILGGWLLEHFWWGSVFLVNAPICALGIAATILFSPPNSTDKGKYWDLYSSLLSLLALSGLTLAIKEATSPDRSVALLTATVIVAVAAATLFVRRQRALEHPLLTFDLFRNRIFTGGVLAAGGGMFAVAGVELLTTQDLQMVGGFSPLEAGLTLAAVTVCAFPFSVLGGVYLHRVGFLPLICGGFCATTLGIAVALLGGAHGTFPVLILGLMLLGVGTGSVMSVSSIAIIDAAPAHRSGMAAGVEEVSYEFGTLISVATAGSLHSAVAISQFHAASDVGGDVFSALKNPATEAMAGEALTGAYSTTLTYLVVVAALLAAVTGWCFRTNPKTATANS